MGQKRMCGISSLMTTLETTDKPYLELLTLYNLANPLNTVRYRTFFALELFCVQYITTDDIEMCCCKKYLLVVESLYITYVTSNA